MIRRAPADAEASIRVVATPVDSVVSEESTTTRNVDDAVMLVASPAVVDAGFRVVAERRGSMVDAFEEPGLELIGSAGSMAADGTLSRVADGTVRVEARGRYAAASVELELERKSGQTSEQWAGWVDGWLAGAAAAGIGGGVARPVCVSASRPAATLIAPRVALGVEHYRPGTRIRWVEPGGTEHERTVVERRDVGIVNSGDAYATDLTVCLLDADLPATVPPALLPPAELAHLLPGVRHGVDGVRTHRTGEHAGELVEVSPTRVRWRGDAPLVSGDSGGAGLLRLPEGWLLTTLWTFGGGGSGPAVHALLPEMQAALDAAAAAAGVSVPPLGAATLGSSYPRSAA